MPLSEKSTQTKQHLSWEASINIKFFLIRLHSSTFVYNSLHSSTIFCNCLDLSSDSSTLIYIRLDSSSDSLHSSIFI